MSGKDPLEADLNFPGSAADIFDGVERINFTCGTNPNTNLYSGNVYSSPQSIPTSVAFERIRRDPATGDMLVDVFVTPKQKVTAPNGGEVLQAVDIFWQRRYYACLSSTVDIWVSRNSGATFDVIAAGVANDGYYRWTPAASDTGTHYRVRVVSGDAAGGVGTDDSDADFTVRPTGGGGGGGCFPLPCETEINPLSARRASGEDGDGAAMTSRLAMRSPSPNPRLAREPLSIEFLQPTSGLVGLKVFDVRGRLVAERPPTWFPGARWQVFRWDLGELEAGLYLTRLSLPAGETVQGKWTVLR